MGTPVREGRLRVEFANLYPGVPAGEWMPVDLLVGSVLSGPVRESGARTETRRILDDTHFEFRGGIARGSTPSPGTRAIDRR